MQKQITSFVNKKAGVLDTRNKKQKNFVKKHYVVNDDKNFHNNDISKKIKMPSRNPLHGYNPGQDEKVYESLIPLFVHTIKANVIEPNKKKSKQINVKIRTPNDSKQNAINIATNHLATNGYKIKNFEHIGMLNEGFYKEQDIKNQDKRIKKNKLISLYMDKLSKNQHLITPEGKQLVLNKMKKLSEGKRINALHDLKHKYGLEEEIQELFENWEDRKNNHGINAFSHLESIKSSIKKILQHAKQYDIYELKSLSRQLEDMAEQAENTSDRIESYYKIGSNYPVPSLDGAQKLKESSEEQIKAFVGKHKPLKGRKLDDGEFHYQGKYEQQKPKFKPVVKKGFLSKFRKQVVHENSDIIESSLEYFSNPELSEGFLRTLDKISGNQKRRIVKKLDKEDYGNPSYRTSTQRDRNLLKSFAIDFANPPKKLFGGKLTKEQRDKLKSRNKAAFNTALSGDENYK